MNSRHITDLRYLLAEHHKVVKSLVVFLLLFTDIYTSVAALQISNTANALVQLNGGPLITLTSNNVDLTLAPPPQKSSVKLLQYAPGSASASSFSIPATRCGPVGGPYITLPQLHTAFGTPIDTSQPVKLAESTVFNSNEAIFVHIVDQNINLDASVIDTVSIFISDTKNNQRSEVRISETAVNSGEFIGYAYAKLCGLQLSNTDKLEIEYVDPIYPFDGFQSEILVDPFGTVFNSKTGEPINGARVSLFNIDTNAAAVVTSFDGLTPYPDTLFSGDTVVDGAGQVFDLPDGFYRFPTIPPGRYQLRVIPPPGFSFPSIEPTDALQILPGAPYAITTGSRGETFVVNPGPAVHLDIPLDPIEVLPFISKKAGKNIVSIGDLLEYQITIARPDSELSFENLLLKDTLPAGFRLHPQSLRIAGQSVDDDDVQLQGRKFAVRLHTIPAGAETTLTYVVEVGPGSRTGAALNSAFLESGTGNISNVSTATVEVKDELFREKGFILGRVVEHGCEEGEDAQPVGVPGIGIYMEDGTFTVTDHDGRYHFEGIRPGTHVVLIDPTSMPKGYRLRLCENNSRTSTTGMSQFVNIENGMLQRADFYIEPEAGFTPQAEATNVQHKNKDNALSRAFLIDKYDDVWLQQQHAEVSLVFPDKFYIPPIPSTHILLKHLPGQTVKLKLNGKAVNTVNFESMRKNRGGTVALSHWRGVDLQAGDNQLEAEIYRQDGELLQTVRQNIHYPTTPVRAEFLPERSTLIADGRSNPVIAIRLLDKDNYPARPGIGGFYSVSAPYTAYRSQDDTAKRELQFIPEQRPQFQVEEDGIAYLPLTPTNNPGEVLINVNLDDKVTQELRAWVTAPAREWLLVGLAESTVAHQRISAHIEDLPEGIKDGFKSENRLAFFAKGQIQGKWLLTLAYDNKAATGEENNSLFQQIDAEEYYPVYADASVQQAHAPSAGKLFIRLQRETFYALLGDYDTGLTVTELARYNRSLYGIKSGLKGEYISYTAFAAETDSNFIKDEIRGDGTSGRYQLSRSNIVHNSEKISIETRERYQSEEIVQQQHLTRYLDYDIDYDSGQLFFKLPVPSRDVDFNPVFIVVDYETQTKTGNAINAGGRLAVNFFDDRVEAGISGIYEGNEGSEAQLEALDMQAQVDPHTKIRLEVAHSRRQHEDDSLSGKAYILEAKRNNGRLDGKVYFRQHDEDFGLGQQRSAESGTRKMGVDLEANWREHQTIELEGYRQEFMSREVTRDLIDVRSKYSGRKSGYHLGMDWARDTDEMDNSTQSIRLLSGANRAVFEGRILARLNAEIALPGQNHNEDFPTRLSAGTDFRLNDTVTLFAEHEFSDGSLRRAHTTNVGYRSSPWAGAQTKSYLGRDINEDSTRLFSSMGFQQRWQINEKWSADFNVDRSSTLDEENTAQNSSANILTSDGPTEDFTAISTGANYRNDKLLGFSRAEYRISDVETRATLGLGLYRELSKGIAYSGSLDTYYEHFDTGLRNTNVELRLGIAYRPDESKWIILNRSDFSLAYRDAGLSANNTYKLVNNTHVNWQWSRRTQLAFRLGLKIAHDTFEQVAATAVTTLSGLELRHDLNERWDIGLHVDALRSWSLDTTQYSSGLSLGFSPVKNAWISSGYNITGFQDGDFIDDEYHAKGFFVTTRVKFDQSTVGAVTRWFQSR